MSFGVECIEEYQKEEREKIKRHTEFFNRALEEVIEKTKETYKSKFGIELQANHFKNISVDGVNQFVVIYEGVAIEIEFNRNIGNLGTRTVNPRYYMLIKCEDCKEYTRIYNTRFILRKEVIGSYLVKSQKCRVCLNKESEERRKEQNAIFKAEDKELSKRFYNLIRDITCNNESEYEY